MHNEEHIDQIINEINQKLFSFLEEKTKNLNEAETIKVHIKVVILQMAGLFLSATGGVNDKNEFERFMYFLISNTEAALNNAKRETRPIIRETNNDHKNL